VILGDANTRQWAYDDERLKNVNFTGLRLSNARLLCQRLLNNYRPDLSAVVLAIGLNDASCTNPAPALNYFADTINDLAQLDPRILFTALPEFDRANVVEGANIVLINKLARAAFKNRFIRLDRSITVDHDDQDLAQPALAYGPVTGRNIYASVAAFLNHCSFFNPLFPPLIT